MLDHFYSHPMIIVSALLVVTVHIQDVRNTQGSIHYLLFNSKKGYPDDESNGFRKGTVKAVDKKIIIDNLPAGEYALTVIHDEDDNGKLNTFLGIPTEGFGFSNNPRVYFGPPSFEKVKFKIEENTNINLKMKYMK